MGTAMRHTLGASLNIRHNLSSSKGPRPLQLNLLTTYIPTTSASTPAFSTSQRLRTNTLTLGISQSGETIDTLEAVRHARHQQSHVIAISNTVGSSIAREADGVLYTHAGPEICVAATKTFATQMVALHVLALYLAQVKGTMFPYEIAEVIDRMRELPGHVEQALGLDDQVRELADRYASA